ncbi:acyl-CoA dehydratase activase [Desulfofustis glycolicus]|uniref:CoA-substrate-specific enzyme activase, putative n=1 Tax=Desulfofustis glycolicus DSM 9705 TaxID=1121409 RepID=A0A1M5VG08_9BACT|nr:acyl-CoA dehydratase activase [Desulfofustis glycolicus]SHH74166.1 CoA-substrate-specific enzyme activase, putative [Desulfofustis glycolicus DSM 9705]
MQQAETILGVDVGSVAVGLVAVDREGRIVFSEYRFHQGQVRSVLEEMLRGRFETGYHPLVAATASTPDVIVTDRSYDNQVAVIAAARRSVPEAGGVLLVGAEKFSLAVFDEDGNYRGTRSNTSCAAGTGGFLDQQAVRLGLQTAERLGRTALACETPGPRIASRCAVFAKTDLIHAQQEGYRLEEISDGLCRGLATNIVDTLFSAEIGDGPIVFCGGVSLNQAVVEHIGALTGRTITVPPQSHLFGAIGAALSLLEDLDVEAIIPVVRHHNEPLFREITRQKSYQYEPLDLRLSSYPDFSGSRRYEFSKQLVTPVEVDIYGDLEQAAAWRVGLGIDIGSTSTKAVLVNGVGEVIAGFYTRTAGRPLVAVQSIFRTIAAIEQEAGRRFQVTACGTTGSGRKFIGTIVGADLVVDEITAHARAACQLNPDVDTIIEIGGQDAKFTTLAEGRVTSSTMNTVCAAGTGSFIEEQASRLNCPLTEISERTAGIAAPMASDRCTVFMERDINHLLSEGYSVNEVLAAVLHSVRENYLLKVASEGAIGEVICFQGATAKNRSLVAAFEQRLGKPIQVSTFCHLTGALGTALIMSDEGHGTAQPSRFAGLDIYRQTIPITSEVCELCTNHCKLSVAEINGRTVAYGFLCGRDYETKSFVKRESSAYDLLGERRRQLASIPVAQPDDEIRIGLPAAVHMVDDLGLWKRFFSYLGIPTVISPSGREALKRGTYLRKAEFCAPVTAMHGHVDLLLGEADYVFLPVYLEDKARDARRQYCYYTQYLAPLTSAAAPRDGERILSPVIRYLFTSFHTKMQLYRMLQPITRRSVSFLEVSAAFDRAVNEDQTWRRQQQEILGRLRGDGGDEEIAIVFLGRPYNVLSPELNGSIPGIFRSLGIDAYFQDMLEIAPEEVARIEPLLTEVHWKFAARILATAEAVAKRPGLYPVYLSSFKCSPDSFAIDYFKRIMAHHNKPYLILELDEHDSNVGYETRIEAAFRAFRNHRGGLAGRKRRAEIFINPHSDRSIDGKTVIFPNWDRLTCSLLVSVLKHEGVDAVLMKETDHSIRQSLKHNTGQCIPLNAIAQGYMDTIRERELDPARCLLWLNESFLACNIRLYPHHIRTILSDHEMGEAGVYLGSLSFSDIGLRTVRDAYFSYLFGGMLRKVCCRIRPYEVYSGETDRVLERSLVMLNEAFRDGRDKEAVLEEIISRFEWIETRPQERPKVAIFGDLYSRDNRILNQDLIRFVEAHGGEVLTTPYVDYAKMIAFPYFRKWFNEGHYLNILANTAALVTMKQLEKTYQSIFDRILHEPHKEFDDSPADILARYNVVPEQTGESMDNLLKVHYTMRYHPEVALFVQASPALCCASLITEAMREKIEEVSGVPVVSVTYDGTGGAKNDVIIPYLRYLRGNAPRDVSLQQAGLT